MHMSELLGDMKLIDLSLKSSCNYDSGFWSVTCCIALVDHKVTARDGIDISGVPY